MTTKNKRKNPRADLRVAVSVEQKSRLQQFYSKNLSTGGIYLELEGEAPTMGTKMNLTFEVPGLPKTIRVEAMVVHRLTFDSMDAEMQNQKLSGIGLKFLNLSPTDRKLINEYVTGKGLHVES